MFDARGHTLLAISRWNWLFGPAVLLMALSACGGNGDPAGGPTGATEAGASPTPGSISGSYVREGYPADVLVLADDGSFCLLQEGWGFEGTYDVDGETLTFTAPDADIVDEKGTIEGGVVVDPGGDRWVRSADAPRCDPSGTPGPVDVGSPSAGTEATLAAIEDGTWPASFDEAAALLEELPEEVAGYAGTTVERSGGPNAVASIEFPDPAYRGPVSGVSYIVIAVPEDLTAAELVDVSAHLGFGLEGESTRLARGDDVPLVVGRIGFMEGPGALPPDHPGYLAVWAPSISAEVVYAITADTPTSRTEAIEVLDATADRG